MARAAQSVSDFKLPKELPMSSTPPADSKRLLTSFVAIGAVALGVGAWIGSSFDDTPAKAGTLTAAAPQSVDPDFGNKVRDYLMENPEVLVEAINVLEVRQRDAEAQNGRVLVETNKAEIFNSAADYVGGNPDGDITVVEFLDYRCSYCRKAMEEVTQLIEKDGNIRFVIKEFPILGQDSELSARFAVAVKQVSGDEIYAGIHDALMTMRGTVTLETLGAMAEQFGADKDAVFKRMNEEDVTAVLRANHQLAERLQISGTPAFVIGGDMMKGYAPLATLQEIVAAERAL
jgi:protein-disulfide isomerase